MDQLNKNNTNNTASSTIQSAIDELSAIKTNKNTSSTNATNTITTNTATNTSTNTTLSSIDSTLNALDNQFPFSEHGARRHSSNLTPSTATQTAKNAELARTLGQYAPSGLNTHPYNPLTHWGSVSSLRNPYPTYGAPRNATKTSIASTKDSNNPRKKSYEDKMDKQRLEHILFSGDQSGPLNQQKERMRQKLQKKQARANNKKAKKSKHKKTQSLPNTSSNTHGLLQLDAAKKQKASGDNNGYFLTEINTKSSSSSSTNKSSTNHATNSNTNKKKKNRGNQRRGHGTKSQRQIKKKPKKQSQNTKGPKKKKKAGQQGKKKSQQNHHKSEGIATKLDECNQAFGEQSKQPNHKDYADQLPGDILNQQRDVFEQEPDEYFHDHDIAPLMQNKLKLELNQQIQGISIWRDKKELEPLLTNGGYNNDYTAHKNENPNLLSPTQNNHTLTDDEEDDPFVDNFVNVGDTDNENEGDVIKNVSSNSNDSDAMEIFIDPNERDTIRQNEEDSDRERDHNNNNNNNNNNAEPGSVPQATNEYQYEGVNSNVDLIKYQDSLRNNHQESNGNETEDTEEERLRRNSALLDSSMTTQVDGGFDVNAEDEEKHIEAPKKPQNNHTQQESLVFDAKGVNRAKEVKFVEEESDTERDLFENMNVKQASGATTATTTDATNERDESEGAAKGEQLHNALEKVLKAAGKKQNGKQEEEREKEREEAPENTKAASNSGNIAATWAKIKNNVQGEGHSHKRNERRNEKKGDHKKNKKKKKNNANDGKMNKKNKQMPKAEKKRKAKESKKNAKQKQNKTNHNHTVKEEDTSAAIKAEDGESTHAMDEKVEKKAIVNNKVKQSQNKKKEKDKSNEKKRKKRAKKKKNNKTKQNRQQEHQHSEKGEAQDAVSPKDGPRVHMDHQNHNMSDDDTTTIDSSSNAPSSTQDPNADDAQDDGGWIIKGNKNKNNKNTKRNSRNTSNRNNNNSQHVSSPRGKDNKDPSTPMSSKSSASKKSSFGYSDSMEVKPNKSDDNNNNKHHKDKESKKKNKKHHKENKKPQIKKSKSVNISTDNHYSNKSTNRMKNRKERRSNNRVNRQKSDPSLANKYPSSTIVVPSRHSKTIHTSMILPKSTNPATSDPLTKHNYPPLKSSHGKKVHFADTNAISKRGKSNKSQPNINVNLSVLPTPTTPTSTASLKNDSVSTTPHSDGGDPHARHPRPTRPPITRLTTNPATNTPRDSGKKENNNHNSSNTLPASNPTLANSQSDHRMDLSTQPQPPLPLLTQPPPQPQQQQQQQQQKPPLLVQRSAPMTGSAHNNNNIDIGYDVSPTNSCHNDTNENVVNNNNNNNNVLPIPPPPPANSSLIASNGTNPTHMALYVDESGNLHETPLTLPDIFPAGLAPTSIPNVLGPLGAVSLPNTDSNNNNTDNGDKPNNTLTGLPVLSVPGLAPPPQPSALGLTSFLPNLAGLPPLPGGVPNVAGLPALTGVAPLNAIPHTIPILLPMPQFTPEQMANLNKLNMIPKAPTGPLPQLPTTNTSSPTTKTALQPIVAAFQPMASKSKKLEDIKEEDEEHETMDSTPNIAQPPMEDTECKQKANRNETDSSENNNNQKKEKENVEDATTTAQVEDEEKVHAKDKRKQKKDDSIDKLSGDATMRNTDSSVHIIAHVEPKSDMECLETFKNDLIAEEKEDEWIEIADLDATMYPATLWCLHVNKWSAHPQCSLKKLQQSMASALMSS